jgi:hypothetical protein
VYIVVNISKSIQGICKETNFWGLNHKFPQERVITDFRTLLTANTLPTIEVVDGWMLQTLFKSKNKFRQQCYFDRFQNFVWERNRGMFWTSSPIRSWSMEPMELKLFMQCYKAIDLSESTECSEIATKNVICITLLYMTLLSQKFFYGCFNFVWYGGSK